MVAFLLSTLLDPLFVSLMVLTGLIVSIVHTDMTCFEIDLPALCAATACVITLLLRSEQNIASHAAGAAIMLMAGLIVQRLFHRGFGLGDHYLYTFMGLCAGLDHLVHLVIANGVFGIITAALYSIARGKPFLRSGFPAAVPGMCATAFVLAIQLIDVSGQPLFGLGSILEFIPLFSIPALVQVIVAWAAIIAGGLVLIIRFFEKEWV